MRLEKETVTQTQRKENMLKVNAKYILKNHILQEAINDAKEGKFTMIDDLLTVALSPFEEHTELEYLNKPTPLKAKNIKLSCSLLIVMTMNLLMKGLFHQTESKINI